MPDGDGKCTRGYRKEKALVRPRVARSKSGSPKRQRRNQNRMVLKNPKFDVTPTGKTMADFMVNKKGRTVYKKASVKASDNFKETEKWENCKGNPLNIGHMRNLYLQKKEAGQPFDWDLEKPICGDEDEVEDFLLRANEEDTTDTEGEEEEEDEEGLEGGRLPTLRRSGPWINIHDPHHSFERLLAGGDDEEGNLAMLAEQAGAAEKRAARRKRRVRLDVCLHKDFQVNTRGNLVYVPKWSRPLQAVLNQLKTKAFVYKHNNQFWYYDGGRPTRFADTAEMKRFIGRKKHLKSVREYRRKAKLRFANQSSLLKGM